MILKSEFFFLIHYKMKWDKQFRYEYRQLYYKICIKKQYDISDYNRFIELSGNGYHKLHKKPLQDIIKPEIFKIEKKKVIIDFS